MSARPASPRRLAALVIAATVLWFVRDALTADATVPARVRPVALAPAQVAPPTDEVCTTPTELPRRGELALVAGGDPFEAPRPVAAASPRTPPPVVADAAPAGPLPAPPPPALPYRFLGVFNEPGKAPSVFLGLGGALIHARAGDTLEGGFRLEAIGGRELTFVQPERGLTLHLPIDGEPS